MGEIEITRRVRYREMPNPNPVASRKSESGGGCLAATIGLIAVCGSLFVGVVLLIVL